MDLAASPPATSLPMVAAPPAARRSAFVAAALGWLVPGLGQFYVGRPGRGLVMMIAIGGLFYAGLRLTDFTCVNPNAYSLEFVAHAFVGGLTAVTYFMTQGFVQSEPLPWFEAGRLYAAVAGLLNVVAICDALGEVLAHNERVRVQSALRRRFMQDRQDELDRLAAAREEAEVGFGAGLDAEATEVPDGARAPGRVETGEIEPESTEQRP